MVRQKVKECINSCVEVKCCIEENANLSIYGLDSLIRVQLVILLEETFNIAFADNDLSQSNFETVNSICYLLKGYGIE